MKVFTGNMNNSILDVKKLNASFFCSPVENMLKEMQLSVQYQKHWAAVMQRMTGSRMWKQPGQHFY
jgi:hypothetical protein